MDADSMDIGAPGSRAPAELTRNGPTQTCGPA